LKLEFSRQISGKKLKYQISRKSVQWEPVFFYAGGRKERRKYTRTMMLIVAFRNFANAPKNKGQDTWTCMSVGSHRVLCHYQCSSTNGPRL